MFKRRMKKIKAILFSLFVFVNTGCKAQSDSLKEEAALIWYTDIMKANQISVASDKPLFAFFTGSDWCPWCKKMQKDVFEKPAFIKWANKNVVLLELDFPRTKTMSSELVKQNRYLQQVFQVQGFPSIYLFLLHKENHEDKYTIENLGSLGYPKVAETGKEELSFIKEADFILIRKAIK
jgi:protein disulfide-isomerase